MEDDDVSHNSSYYERLLEEELAKMEFEPEEGYDVIDSDNEYPANNDILGQSHTSFKSMMSNDTVIT